MHQVPYTSNFIQCFGSVFNWIRIQPKIPILIQKTSNPDPSYFWTVGIWQNLNYFIIIRFSHQRSQLKDRMLEKSLKSKIVLWLFTIFDLFLSPWILIRNTGFLDQNLPFFTWIVLKSCFRFSFKMFFSLDTLTLHKVWYNTGIVFYITGFISFELVRLQVEDTGISSGQMVSGYFSCLL